MRFAPTVILLLASCNAPTPLQRYVIDPYVEVRSDHGIGSATVIRWKGETLILTAAHVVSHEGEPEKAGIVLRQESGGKTVEREAEVVHFSAPEEYGGHDLALLKPADASGLVAAKLGLKLKLTPGQDCWIIGTGGGIHRNLARTIINRTDFRAVKGNIFTLANDGWFGHSGGGLYVRDGEGYALAGVIVRIAWNGPRAPTLAQSQKTIAEFLGEYKPAKK